MLRIIMLLMRDLRGCEIMNELQVTSTSLNEKYEISVNCKKKLNPFILISF